jgi:hypothetical protein
MDCNLFYLSNEASSEKLLISSDLTSPEILSLTNINGMIENLSVLLDSERKGNGLHHSESVGFFRVLGRVRP